MVIPFQRLARNVSGHKYSHVFSSIYLVSQRTAILLSSHRFFAAFRFRVIIPTAVGSSCRIPSRDVLKSLRNQIQAPLVRSLGELVIGIHSSETTATR